MVERMGEEKGGFEEFDEEENLSPQHEKTGTCCWKASPPPPPRSFYVVESFSSKRNGSRTLSWMMLHPTREMKKQHQPSVFG